MILPLGDEPNPSSVPVVTYALILVNCAAYLFVTIPLSFVGPEPGDPVIVDYLNALQQAMSRRLSPRAADAIVGGLSQYDLFVFQWGFRPVAPRTINLLTAMFLHAGFFHLVGNMLFLWIYGDNVEHRLGRARYLAAYLGTGVAATLFHLVVAGPSPLPLLGASGAISGVLGFYFVWFPRNRVRLWVMLFPFFMNVVHAPARWVLGFYVIADNVLPLLATGGAGDGVAYGAHIGGFLGGVVVAWVANRRTVLVRPTDFGTPPSAPVRQETPGSLAALVEDGDFEDAARVYVGLSARETVRLLSEPQSLALGNWMAARGHIHAALTVFQRHLRDHPVGAASADAHVGAGLLQLRAFGQPTAAYQHLVEALELNPSPRTEALARQGLAQITALQKFQLNSM